MVNIIINDYNEDNQCSVCDGKDEIVTILNDNIKMDVDLIEQVEKLAKSNSLLVQHITKLEKTNETLLELIKQSNQKVDEALVEINLIKDNCNNQQKNKTTVTVKKETKKDNKKKLTPSNKKMKRGKSVKDTDKYIPNKSLQKEWKQLKLHKDGTIWNHAKRIYKLPVDLNLLLYIQECDKTTMNRATAKLLMSKYDIQYGTFGKIIYNLRETDNFKKIINEYYTKLNKAKFTIKNNKICVNKKNTDIPLALAKEWLHIIVNSDYKQKTIRTLQKEYSEYDKDMIRIICESYNNNELSKLIKNVKKNTFVENNVSKRKNMIKNGVLI